VSGRALLAALAASVVLAGCTTLGGNVKGSFWCAAPDGVCAPSSVIDDRALAMISGATDVVPAGPYTPAQDVVRGVRVASNGAVARTDQKVLKIVFPAHVDQQGLYHETAAIRAVVDNGTWLASAKTAGVPAVAAADGGGDVQVAAIDRAELALPVDLASAVAQAPSVSAAPPVSREGLMAQVNQLLAKPGQAAAPGRAKDTTATAIDPAAQASAASVSSSPHGIALSPVAPSASVSAASAAPVNRPASFSGTVGD